MDIERRKEFVVETFFIDMNNKLSFLLTAILGISRNQWIAVFLYNLKSTKKVCFNIIRMKNCFHCSKWYASVHKNQDKKTCSLASRANGYSSLDIKGRKINWQKKKKIFTFSLFYSLLIRKWFRLFVYSFVFQNANEKFFLYPRSFLWIKLPLKRTVWKSSNLTFDRLISKIIKN